VNAPVFCPDWRQLVSFPPQGVSPHVLAETPTYRAVVAGLAAGNAIPPHAEGAAVFHFLDGSGQMRVDEETFAVRAGATVVVPAGALRGMHAETRIAFLAVRILA